MIPDIESKVKTARLEFQAIGAAFYPPGKLAQIYQELGENSGLPALRLVINLLQRETTMQLKDAPAALKSAGVEALLVDQVSPAGGTIADFLGIPFVTVCNALLINREDGVPPYFTHWSYNTHWWARLRNRVGNYFLQRILQPIRSIIIEQRHQWKLPTYVHWEDAYSQLAQICQLPVEYDFPRVTLPGWFHYTGPLQDPSGQELISFPSLAFPFEKLTGQPLIYAALGTLQNRKPEIFQSMAEACVGLDMQLVISLGNPDSQESNTNLPGSPIVVPFAPQQQLIQKATLTITHAGMNTVLGALSSGVPLVAIPITSEQPGIAARLARTGAGEVVALSGLSVPKLRAVIKRVLTEDSYKQNALRLQQAIQKAGGVSRAADLIEQAVSTGKPVVRSI